MANFSTPNRWLVASVYTALYLPSLAWSAEGGLSPRFTRVQAATKPQEAALPPIVTPDSAPKKPNRTRTEEQQPEAEKPLSRWMQEIDPAVREGGAKSAEKPIKVSGNPAAKGGATGPAIDLLGRMRAAAAEVVKDRTPASKSIAAGNKRPTVPAANEIAPVRFQAKVEDRTATIVRIKTDDAEEPAQPEGLAPIHPELEPAADERSEAEASLAAPPQASSRRAFAIKPAKDAFSTKAAKSETKQSRPLKLLVKINPETGTDTEPKYRLLDDVLKEIYPDREVSVFFMPEPTEMEKAAQSDE